MSAPPTALTIRPQPGPQELFFSSPADIVIYGGAAGGGKSWALLHEPLRHHENPDFGAVIFRRTSKQARNEGGLWDESQRIYPLFGAEAREQMLEWSFPSGSKITFAHLQHEKNKLDWQGAQVAMIGFDELTHFTKSQFFYLLSRNRSTCGVRPYVRATTNPDADSWVADFIAWWIGEDGYPIPERAGAIRYFARDGDTFFWGDSVEEVLAQAPAVAALDMPDEDKVKSVTFIPASVEDNPALLKTDPGYMANLLAQDLVDKERLLKGNWKIRRENGTVFRREWFKLVDEKAPKSARRVRFWDCAGTDEDEQADDPDWTVGLLMAVDTFGYVTVEDVIRVRMAPGPLEELIHQTAVLDGIDVAVRMEQEPGSSGKSVIHRYANEVLSGFDFAGVPSTGDKVTRAKPFSAAAYNGRVRVLNAPWAAEYISEHSAFPTPNVHDDQVDGSSGAFNFLHEDNTDFLERMVTM